MRFNPARALPRLLLVVPLALAMAPLTAPMAAAQPVTTTDAAAPTGRITVTGIGKASAAPDMAMVTLGVRTEGPDAASAMASNNERQAAVIAALKEAGIAARDLQTSGFAIDQRMTYPDGQPPQVTGYVATNMVTVRVRDLAALGSLLDKAITAGATNLNGLDFLREDDAALRDQARKAAMEDAIHRATLFAEAAGVKLGPVRVITETAPRMQPRPMAMVARDAAAPAAPIEAGELGLTAEVTVEFSLLQ